MRRRPQTAMGDLFDRPSDPAWVEQEKKEARDLLCGFAGEPCGLCGENQAIGVADGKPACKKCLSASIKKFMNGWRQGDE